MPRADGPALRRAALHLGVLAVTGTLLWRLRATVWALPLLVAHGYVLAFVFCAFHETAHRTAFRTRWLNAALGTLAGLLIFWPYRNYRVYHWEHHRFTQDEARVYLAAYVAIVLISLWAASPLALVGWWIVPLLIGQAFLRPYLLAEHTACAFTRDCLENTRTTRTLAVVRLFAWNMPYHAEHHAFPAVPFHALPRLHAHVRARLANLEPGYGAATVKVNRYLFGDHRGIGRRGRFR